MPDQLDGSFWDISFSLAGLDVGKCPLFILLRHQFETKNTILSKEHVLGEDVHAIDTLRTKAICQRVISVEILLEGYTKDRTITISRECTGQNRDISKAALKRLVWGASMSVDGKVNRKLLTQYVRHLIFEVLCGDQGVEQLFSFINHSVNLAATSPKVRIVVERLPEVID